MTSGRKLATYVHVVELDAEGAPTGRSGTFGPSDDLPEWVEPAISNPDVWADAAAPTSAQEPSTSATEVPNFGTTNPPAVPPRSGPGSGTPAWSAYASAQGITVDDGAGRADIIATLTAAGVPVE
jgi:hypothetical protein